MSPEAQRIAIAKACGVELLTPGWVPTYNDPDNSSGAQQAEPAELPDYLNDLNAMHEAEKVLLSQSVINRPKTPWHVYFPTLHRMCQVPPDTFDKPLQAEHWAITATAAQRAEAFLRTLGLWEATS